VASIQSGHVKSEVTVIQNLAPAEELKATSHLNETSTSSLVHNSQPTHEKTGEFSVFNKSNVHINYEDNKPVKKLDPVSYQIDFLPFSNRGEEEDADMVMDGPLSSLYD